MIARFPDAVITQLIGYLSPRDVLAVCLVRRGKADLRSRLTMREFKKACTPPSRSSLSPLSHSLNWDFLKNCTAKQWFEEYLFINKKACVDLNVATADPGTVDFDYDSCNIGLASRQEFSYNCVSHVAIHPHLRLAAFVVQDRSDYSDTTSLDSKLMVRSFGKPYEHWGPDTLLSEITYKTRPKSHRSNDLFASWSPCGHFLSAIERTNTYCGEQAQAAVHIYQLDAHRAAVRPIRNVDIRVSAFAIGSNLWIGPGAMVLPDPLNRGDEPSVLRLCWKDSSATLLLPSPERKEKYYNRPAGLLTGLGNGMSAFVVFCRDSEDSFQGAQADPILCEHEHQRLIVLDDNQKRCMEIDVPGIVVAISSHEHKVCFVYRENAGAKFDCTAPNCCRQEASLPRRVDSFPRDPYSFCTSSGSAGDKLQYRSYPRYGQPWCARQDEEDRAQEKLLKQACSLCPVSKAYRQLLRRCRINTSEPAAYSTTLDSRTPDYTGGFFDNSGASGNEDDEANGDNDGDDDGGKSTTDSELDESGGLFSFASPKRKKARSREDRRAGKRASKVFDGRDVCSSHDTSEGTSRHRAFSSLQTSFFYAEADVSENSIDTLISLNNSCQLKFSGLAHEVRNNPGERSSRANQTLLLAKTGCVNPLTVTSSAAIIDSGSLLAGGAMNRNNLVLMRHHPLLPLLADKHYSVATVEPNTLRYARHYGRGAATSAVSFKSMNPGLDAPYAISAFAYCPTSEVAYSNRVEKK